MPRPTPPVDADTLVHGLVRIVLDSAAPVGLRFAGPDEAAPRLDPARLPPHRFEMHVLPDKAALRALVLGLRLGRRNDIAWLAHEELPLLLLAELEACPRREAADLEAAIPIEAEAGVHATLSGWVANELRAEDAYRGWRRAAAAAVRRWRPVLQVLSGRRACLLEAARDHNKARFSWRPPGTWSSFDFTMERVHWENGRRSVTPHPDGYRLVVDIADHNLPSGALTRRALGAEAERPLAALGFAWSTGSGDKSSRIIAQCPDAATLAARIAAADQAASEARALRRRAVERPREVAAMTQPKAIEVLQRIVADEAPKVPGTARATLLAAGLIDDAGAATEAGRRVAAEYRALAPAHPQDGPTYTQALYLASMACLDFTLGLSTWRSVHVRRPFYGPDTLKSPPESQIDAMIGRGWLRKGARLANGGDTELLLTDAGRAILPGAPAAPAVSEATGA